MYKKYILGVVISLLVVGALVTSGCAHKSPIEAVSDQERLKVAVTIYPLYDIVKTIGGENIDPILILPPGSSPHTYEATPSQVKEMQNVKLFFTIGAGVDGWAKNIAKAINDTEIIDLDQYMTLKPFEHQELEYAESGTETDDHVGLDPHYWLSPSNAKIMAEQISRKLSLLDPANQVYYDFQAQNFISELTAKDLEWKNKISELNKKEIVVFHDAWGYFANHFGLKIVATFEPFPGKTPSPQYLIGLHEIVKEKEITALFVEPQLSKEAITTLASDLKVKVGILDPLGGIDERNSYIGTIDYNINNIYQALK